MREYLVPRWQDSESFVHFSQMRLRQDAEGTDTSRMTRDRFGVYSHDIQKKMQARLDLVTWDAGRSSKRASKYLAECSSAMN